MSHRYTKRQTVPSDVTMSWWKRRVKPSFRNYTLSLVMLYLFLVFAFHSRLDPSNSDDRAALNDIDADVAARAEIGKSTSKHSDVIEQRGDRPEVVVDPDSRAARYLREYRARYANPPDHDFNREANVIAPAVPPLDDNCLGTPIPESHEFVEVAPELHVYSVFWDTRYNDFDNNDTGVHLRIMTIMKRHRAQAQPPVYCIFRNASHDWIPVQVTYYEMCENHDGHNGGYILSCKVPRHVYGDDKCTSVCSVRLSGDCRRDSNATVQEFKVINTVAHAERRNFSICVAPLYGHLSHDQLIEFMELSALLGANHVTFYDFNIAPQTASLLRYYERVKRVTLIPWGLSNYFDNSVWYHGQLVSILDCLYRNMALTKYLAFNDIDEYMIPYEYVDWSAMMTSLDDDDKCGYQFNSVFIDPSKQADTYEGPEEYRHLTTLRNTRRSVVRSKVRTKCMLKPQLVFEAGIHHISKPIVAHLQTVRMDLPQALLHHHRACQPNFGMNCHDFIDDAVVRTRYAAHLYERFNTSMQLFRGHGNS